jgi:diguanylate cyclase (GGDEF)-like protein
METILIVDDTKANIHILIELLGEKYDILISRCGADAIDMAKEEKPDLILLDIIMPQMDGFDVCRELKNSTETKDIPVIFLTAQSDEDSIEKAYDTGGIDYVTKPFRPKELIARVNRELELVRLQNELKLLASTDPMTKLYNRRFFIQTSEHIVELAKRDKQEVALIMIDIDRFKTINDTYGHAIGDKVIVEFSKILKEVQRKSDIVCRFGGEEFVALLPKTDSDGAKIVAEKIREKTESTTLQLLNSELRFTVSLGISTIKIESEISIESALQRADTALYRAKNSGRNRAILG